jgi:hypothetical protein
MTRRSRWRPAADDPALIPVVRLYCFFMCGTVVAVSAFDSELGHQQMEAHYTAEHREEIDRIVEAMKP